MIGVAVILAGGFFTVEWVLAHALSWWIVLSCFCGGTYRGWHADPRLVTVRLLVTDVLLTGTVFEAAVALGQVIGFADPLFALAGGLLVGLWFVYGAGVAVGQWLRRHRGV